MTHDDINSGIPHASDRFWIRPVSFLGVLRVCGLFKRGAILDAAGQGVCNRMWGETDETESLERLQPSDYQQIQQHMTDVESQFQKTAIARRQTDPQRLREAWSLSRFLLGLIYLEVGDALVYASALLAEADELWSGDDYLRKVVNRIHNPA